MFRTLRVASLVTLVCTLCAAEARAVSILLLASVGAATTSKELRDPDKSFEQDDENATLVSAAILGGTDLFGLLSARVDGNFDPWFAARFAITNTTDDPQSVGASLRFPMEPVQTPSTPPVSTFTGLFTAELVDTDGDGTASYTGGGAGFALFETILGASLTSSHSVQLMAPGLANVYDIAEEPIPASPRIGQWNGMEFVHLAGGQLSPHDTIEFYVFGCVALPGTSCPAPPELVLVPEPATFWLLASSFAGLAAWRRSARM